MSKRVLIVGGGVVGLCTAYYCAQRGFEVAVVERRAAVRSGCSFGNAGMIVPSHFIPLAAPGAVALALKWMRDPASPFYIKPRWEPELFRWGLRFWRAANAAHVRRAAPLLRDLALASRTAYEEFAREFSAPPGNSGATERGALLRPGPDQEPGVAQAFQPAGAPDFPVRRGSGDWKVAPTDRQECLPYPPVPQEIGSFGLTQKGLLMLCKEAHTLDEEAKTAEQARALGIPADVLDAKRTAALDPGARLDIAGAVHFPLDCHLVPERFIAALEAQLQQLGVDFAWASEVLDWEIQDGRIRAVTVFGNRHMEADEFVLCGGSWSPRLARRLGLKISIQAGKGYSLTLPQPRQQPQICSILVEARVAVTPMGETLRVGGTMEMAGLNEDINPVRVRGIISSFCRYFPDFQSADFDGIRPWCGLRPCSPDGLPFVGRVRAYANLSVATGHAMMGMTLGPVTGKLIAQIISGEKPALDIGLLSPNRYQ